MDAARAAEHTSLCAQVCTEEVWDKYKDTVSSGPAKWTLARAINTGVIYPHSFVGCHAGDSSSYENEYSALASMRSSSGSRLSSSCAAGRQLGSGGAPRAADDRARRPLSRPRTGAAAARAMSQSHGKPIARICGGGGLYEICHLAS